MPSADDDVTQLLARWANGDRAALDALMPIVYNELHKRPTIALILTLLSANASERLRHRRTFAASAPLADQAPPLLPRGGCNSCDRRPPRAGGAE